MEFRVLGPLEIRHKGGSLPTGSARERFVLATLLLSAGRLVTTDRLVDGLWRTPPQSAKAQLHNLVSKIRSRFRETDDRLIVTRSSGYELRIDPHRLDLMEFRRLVSEGEQRYAVGDHSGATTVLHQALKLSRGPVLADVPGEFEIRQTFPEELLAAIETKLDADLALGRTEEVLRELTPLLDQHPYREHLYRRQMVALVAAGRRADALAVYQMAYRRLVDDLGVEPGAPLRDLERQIVCGEPVIEPSATRVIPRQLPPVVTVVTGRETLLGHITEELDRSGAGGSPVVALVGPGGVGKTVLALAAGHRLGLRHPTIDSQSGALPPDRLAGRGRAGPVPCSNSATPPLVTSRRHGRVAPNGSRSSTNWRLRRPACADPGLWSDRGFSLGPPANSSQVNNRHKVNSGRFGMAN